MLTFYPVEISKDLSRDNPLYVGNYFQLKGMWWSKRKQRQGLIIAVALGWYRLAKKSKMSPGFIQDEVLLTQLTKQVNDARIILERFFQIDRLGFNFNDGNKSATQVTPRRLGKKFISAIEHILNDVNFNPGPPPSDKGLITSKVPIHTKNALIIKRKLCEEKRDDLLPAVSWLLERTSVDFYYKPSGRLQARDTSVWPIRAVELWPGWLRKQLFGTVVDIENSFCQFVVSSLLKKYDANSRALQLKYPDIFRADQDKQNFRNEICKDVLRLPITTDNISVVKKLIMSLANGSNATPALMTNGSGRSEAVRIVLTANPDLKPSELIEVGKRLSFIAKQFRAAKKELCMHLLGLKPTASNSKKIFSAYLEWERQQRYKIWEAVGKTGLHLHDGVDGVITDLSDEDLERKITEETQIRVSVESPELLYA